MLGAAGRASDAATPAGGQRRMVHEQANHLSCVTRRDATRRANLGTYQA